MIKLIIVYILVEIFEWFSSWGSLAQQKQPAYIKHINISSMCLSYLLNIILGTVGLCLIDNFKLVTFIVSFILVLWIRDIITGILTKLFMMFQYKLYRKYQAKKLKERLNDETSN